MPKHEQPTSIPTDFDVETQRASYQCGWQDGVKGSDASPRDPSTADAYMLGHADGCAAHAMMVSGMLRLYPRQKPTGNP